MAPESQTTEALVFQAADGGSYAIPWSVVETGRIPAEQVPNPDELAEPEPADVSGFRGGALLPYAEDGSYFALPAEVIERYRVPAEQEAAIADMLTSDVAGYGHAYGHSGGPPGRGGGPPFGDVTIINQYNIQMGVNLAYNSPGAIMTVGQTGLNSVS